MLNRPGLFIARLQACDLGIIDEHLCFTLWYGNCKLIETPSGNCTQFPRQQCVARVSLVETVGVVADGKVVFWSVRLL